VSAVGIAFPLHCTANGKALLALLPKAQRERELANRLKRYTNATIVERSVLEAELHDVERSDLAFDIEEHSEGICAVGTAFRDSLGRPYSLSIPLPAARFNGKRQLLSKMLKKTRRVISASGKRNNENSF